MSIWSRIWAWLEFRLGTRETVLPPLLHRVPRGTGWWYVFGSASMTLLLMQIVSGACLALVYVPSAETAYETLEYLNYQQEFGWMLRALHFWAASGMVVMVIVHMAQVFIFGAFKYPRELTWILWTGAALGSGRLLGRWGRCCDGWSDSVFWACRRATSHWRGGDRGRNAKPLLYTTRVYLAGSVAFPPCHSPASGSQAWYLRATRSG
jgi:hypothetical protein